MTKTTLPERNLDVLRAIAVLAVFANHVINALAGHITPGAAWLGRAGVAAFFVHTSLVLMGSMEKDGAPGRAGWMKRFYIRRAFRIYPLAIAVIALVLLLHVPPRTVHGPREYFSVADIAANVALVQDVLHRPFVLGVLWTLPLELQMYAVLPLCYLIARLRTLHWFAVMMLVGIALPVLYTQGANAIPGIWRLPVLDSVPCFLSGVLAYRLLRHWEPVKISAHLWIPIIAIDLVLGYLAWNVIPDSWIVRAAFCVVLGIAIPLVAELKASPLTRMAHTVALYSYGIYLLHPIALWFGFHVLRELPFVVQCLAILASLAMGCIAAYTLIEKPGIELGRAIAHQRTPVAAEPAAP